MPWHTSGDGKGGVLAIAVCAKTSLTCVAVLSCITCMSSLACPIRRWCRQPNYLTGALAVLCLQRAGSGARKGCPCRFPVCQDWALVGRNAFAHGGGIH